MEQKFPILIVDDDVDLASNLQDTLEEEGYSIAVANNGQSALTLCCQKVFDLALIDIKLPDIPGVKLVGKIAKLCPETEYIIITGYASLESAIEAVSQRSIAAYQTKPLDMDHLLSLIKQVTERKRVEEALRESEEKYRSLVESSEDSICLVDGNCKYLFMNSKYLSRLGLQMSQVMGKAYGESHLPEETEEFAKKIKEVLEAGKSLSYEYRSGSDNRYFIRTLSPVKNSGTGIPTAVTVISKDITEHKKAEAHLIQAAKMATLGQMASGIAHELNQPLSVIKIGSDFLLKMIKRGEKIDDEELNIIALEVGAQVDRASGIINHLRTFARVSETVKGEMGINAPIRDIFKILGQQLTVHGIEVKLDLDESLPSVMADHNRLEQVFINLVTNAIDAMDEKEKRLGKEKIEKVLSIRSYLEDREIVVTVSDTGIGIPEKIMDRLFEPFFTTKQVGKGTGLGLSISYGIVKNYDGVIDVKSEEGIGTTFLLRFPACERRKFLRTHISVEVGAKHSDWPLIKVKSFDISGGGIRLFLPKELPKGEAMDLEIGPFSLPVIARGKVVWTKEAETKEGKFFQTGMEFTGINPTDKARIEAFTRDGFL